MNYVTSLSGNRYEFKKISELDEDSPTKCIIIGTLFKNMILKPSILKEIAEENLLAPLPPPENYNHESDDIVLEDEIQRVKLTGNINVGELVTGVVVAVLGLYFLKTTNILYF
jgi:DNA polymerase delta subunit 2